MATINPTADNLTTNQTQQFTQSGITSPVWTLEGLGSLTQGGLFTAPNQGGVSALVRVHSAAWNSVNTAYFTKNADDTLTKANNDAGYFPDTKSNARLNSVGDAVEVICYMNTPYWVGLENLDNSQRFVWISAAAALREYHPSGNHDHITPTPQAGDVLRFEIITGGYMRFSINGVVQGTSTNVFTGGNFRLYVDGTAAAGTVYKVPKFFGSGITNYDEAQATVTTLTLLLTGYNGAELYCEARLMSQSDASIVSSFTDQSGKGRHLTTSTNNPTFETNEINGHPVIRFHGTSNPLKNTAQFTIRCGWILAKYLDTSFSDFKGLLSDLVGTTILVSNNSGANFFDMEMELFEFRSNDRIYPETAMPAPMQVFKLIFFRFWKNLPLDGIQLGQQTTFTGRKWFGDVPFLALYSRDFCERDIRKYSKAIADAYGLTLADVYPFQADKGTPRTPVQSVNFYDPPEGERISEVLDDAKLDLDLKFSARRQSEFQEMKAYHASHYGAAVECIYRDYDVIPPEDISGYINSPYQASGAVNDWSYAFKFKEK